MGAIEFFIPFLILNDFGAHDRIFFQKHSLYSLDLDDFGAPPPSMLEDLRAKRLDPFFKINIDEGGGAEIEQKLVVLM